jgi:hypothetical protein
MLPGQPPQLVVDQWKQLIEGVAAASAPFM